MYIHRDLETYIAKISGFFPVLLLTGPRQVGKTTLLRHVAGPERKYVSLDDPAARHLALNDPKGFIERYAPPVIIDEIQYAPELLTYIKIVVDEQRFKEKEHSQGLYWLTGSQQFQMMKGVSESLAGRVGIIDLLGLSESEREHRPSQSFLPDREFPMKETSIGTMELFRKIWRGSFPAMIEAGNDPQLRNAFFSSYLQTYLERDVRDLEHVADLDRFYAFIRSVAARTGQLINHSELARDAEISVPTAKSWLSILRASGIVYLLPAYTSSLTARLVKAPKLYMLDTGLCSYLTQWPSPETLEAGAMSGAIFETWCFSEILKSYYHSGESRVPLFFYRDKDQKEIDLLIEQAGKLYPVEFKKSASPKPSDCRHFSVLERFNKPVGTGALVSMYSAWLPHPKDNCTFIPAPLI